MAEFEERFGVRVHCQTRPPPEESNMQGHQLTAGRLGTTDFSECASASPAGRKDPAADVLENFTAAERAEVHTIGEQAADATELLVALGLKPGQNTVHAW
jgi:peptidyl-tRNA hydrolase, PTH1 family